MNVSNQKKCGCCGLPPITCPVTGLLICSLTSEAEMRANIMRWSWLGELAKLERQAEQSLPYSLVGVRQ